MSEFPWQTKNIIQKRQKKENKCRKPLRKKNISARQKWEHSPRHHQTFTETSSNINNSTEKRIITILWLYSKLSLKIQQIRLARTQITISQVATAPLQLSEAAKKLEDDLVNALRLDTPPDSDGEFSCNGSPILFAFVLSQESSNK